MTNAFTTEDKLAVLDREIVRRKRACKRDENGNLPEWRFRELEILKAIAQDIRKEAGSNGA